MTKRDLTEDVLMSACNSDTLVELKHLWTITNLNYILWLNFTYDNPVQMAIIVTYPAFQAVQFCLDPNMIGPIPNVHKVTVTVSQGLSFIP